MYPSYEQQIKKIQKDINEGRNKEKILEEIIHNNYNKKVPDGLLHICMKYNIGTIHFLNESLKFKSYISIMKQYPESDAYAYLKYREHENELKVNSFNFEECFTDMLYDKYKYKYFNDIKEEDAKILIKAKMFNFLRDKTMNTMVENIDEALKNSNWLESPY